MAKKINKRLNRYVKRYILITIGCLVTAFGAAVFLTPCNIVSGGITSIGIIVNHYLQPAVGFDTNSLISAILQVAAILAGCLVLGKAFGIRTIVASVLFIGFYSLFLELNIGVVLGLQPVYDQVNGDIVNSLGSLTLMGLTGGALQGVGLAMAYLAGGSTGGTDVPARIIAKFTNIKESVPVFAIDLVLIVAGGLVFKNFLTVLIGVLVAFVTSVGLDVIYSNINSSLVVDIISDKYKEIQEFVHNEMENDGHASTLIHAQGGYSGVEKEMLRVVIFKREESRFRSVIYKIDPTAFIVISQAKSIHGDGFTPLMAQSAIKIKKKKKEKK